MRWVVNSPDGRLAIELSGDEREPRPVEYRVFHDGREAVGASRLGLEHQGASFTDVTVAAGPVARVEDDYELAHGKRRRVRSRGRELTFALTNEAGAVAQIVARAYDDGAAFRYVVDLGAGRGSRLTAEHTEFRLGPGRAWAQSRDAPSLFTPAYEAAYDDGAAIGSAPDGSSWNMPALFETAGRWALIAETGLTPPCFGAHLVAADGADGVAADGADGVAYRVAPPEEGEGLGWGDVWPVIEGRWRSPWRVIVVGDLAAIVESTLVTDLAAPSRLSDEPWVRPGRVSWSWWSDRASPRSLDALRRYADFAADMGWEHTLVDANWDTHDEADIRALVERAAAGGVGVWLWYNSGGPHNDVTEGPRNRMHEPETRRRELRKLSEWGVAGAKVDFFQSDKPDVVKLMWDILADAAEHRLMVNMHGCAPPRGWQRTWPHLLTTEGVRGAEQYLFDAEYAEIAPRHNTILPYTRNAVGPMDYTPVTVGPRPGGRLTTAAHELALAVVFESGAQHFADSIEAYESLPPGAVDFLRRVPAAWDETRHVAGYPGRSSALARRSGGSWHIAGIAGPERRELEMELPFLDRPRQGVLIADDGDALSITDASVEPDSPLCLTLEPGGGFVLRLPG